MLSLRRRNACIGYNSERLGSCCWFCSNRPHNRCGQAHVFLPPTHVFLLLIAFMQRIVIRPRRMMRYDMRKG